MKKLFVVGDSISCYYGKYLGGYLHGFMAYDRKGGTNVIADLDDCTNGVNGGDSCMVLTYVEALVTQQWFSPDLFLFNCGLHDTKLHLDSGRLQIPLAQYEQNLKQVLDLVRSSGAMPVWCRTTPLNESSQKPAEAKVWHRPAGIDLYNAVADRIMAEESVRSIDLFTFTKALGYDIYLNGSDHVHFNEAASALQAAFIAGALVQL